MLQHDDGHTVWATRGYAVYRSRGGDAFERVFRVRPQLGKAWAGHLATLRSRFGYQELIELLPLGDERLVVFAAGGVHTVDLKARAIERTHRLRYFGPGKGRGLMAFGLTADSTGAIYYGEYTTEAGERPISIWKSSDEGRSWQEAFEFPAGTVRHVHAVQCDPHDGAIWVGTGDRDEQCYVGVSHDGAATFRWIAQGTQQCRTCGFVFFPDVVLWGMDAGFEANRLIRLQRENGTLAADEHLPDATYYHRKLDESRALLGLAQDLAEVWVANVGRICLPVARVVGSSRSVTRAGLRSTARPRGGGDAGRIRAREPDSHGRARSSDLPNSEERRPGSVVTALRAPAAGRRLGERLPFARFLLLESGHSPSGFLGRLLVGLRDRSRLASLGSRPPIDLRSGSGLGSTHDGRRLSGLFRGGGWFLGLKEAPRRHRRDLVVRRGRRAVAGDDRLSRQLRGLGRRLLDAHETRRLDRHDAVGRRGRCAVAGDPRLSRQLRGFGRLLRSHETWRLHWPSLLFDHVAVDECQPILGKAGQRLELFFVAVTRGDPDLPRHNGMLRREPLRITGGRGGGGSTDG